MKQFFFVLLGCLTINTFAQVKVINFNSDKLQEKRELYISLPSSYEKNPTKRYPLLLVLDADYLLNPFIETLKYGAYWDDLPEVIIIGISQNKNDQRTLDCGLDEVTGLPDGKSVDFFDFIALELMPFVQKDYRTTDFKIIAGHDITAAFSNFFLYKDNPLFNAFINISPELPVNMENELPDFLSASKFPLFYYLSTANGDELKMRERIKTLDSKIQTIQNPNLNYKFEHFKEASHFSIVLHSVPTAMYQIFASAKPISTEEFNTSIVTLKSGYVEYLTKKYDIIENSFGIKNPIRINDFKAIEAAILKNKDYNELDALAILADKHYPKSMLSDYLLAIMFEYKGDNQRAVRYYMSGFNKEEIAELTKDMMFAKAEELKKTFAKKPKIKGKVGQDAESKDQPTEATPETEEKKQE